MDETIIEPSHDVRFGPRDSLQSVAFSSDGDSLYVHLFTPTVNVWHLLVGEWRIVLGVPAAIIVAVCLVGVIRVVMRRRSPGRSYCRRCNYCLDGVMTDAPCPECGKRPGSKARIVGRPVWRRSLVWSVIGGSVIAMYGALWAFGMPASVRGWNEWHSSGLIKRTNNPKWLRRYMDRRDRLVEIDPATGVARRIVGTYSSKSYASIFVTPDDRFILTADREIRRIDVRTGRVIRRAKLANNNQRAAYPIVLGVRDGAAILLYGDLDARVNRLAAWDLRSGDLEILHESELYVIDERLPSVRAGALLPGEPLRVVTTPTSLENYEQRDEFAVRHIDVESGVTREIVLDRTPEPDARPVVDAESGVFYLNNTINVTAAYDLETGERLRRLRGRPYDLRGGINLRAARIVGPRRWILLFGPYGQVRIRHLDHDVEVATLRYPLELRIPRAAISADGRFAAIEGEFDLGPRPGSPAGASHLSVDGLVIYDLRELD